jgi:hypothetical protein
MMSQMTVVREPSTLCLEDFFQHVRHSNPFESNCISDPDSMACDVPAINGQAHRDLVDFADSARALRKGIGVVVWGEAGVGKSHVLGRFCRNLKEDGCFAFLHNLHASPERLPRYVLKSVIAHLTDCQSGHFHETRLYRLVERAVQEAAVRMDKSGKKQFSMEEAIEAFVQSTDLLIRKHPAHVRADLRSAYSVLFALFQCARFVNRDGDSKQARQQCVDLAVRWISGDVLEVNEASQIGVQHVGQGNELALTDEAVPCVLTAIAELAALNGTTFVLIFDQVDNLSDEQISALTSFAHALIDHVPNLLVVTSGVQRKLSESVDRGVVNTSSWNRINQENISLGRIFADAAKELLIARRDTFLERYAEVLPEVQTEIARDPLFPLGTAWFEKQTKDALELRPRDVINWAKLRWREQARRLESLGGREWLCRWNDDDVPRSTRGAIQVFAKSLSESELLQLIDEKIAGKLLEHEHRRNLDRGMLPPDAGNLCGLTEQLLRQCLTTDVGYSLRSVESVAAKQKKLLSAYDLMIDEESPTGSRHCTGIKFLATGNRTSMTMSLARIASDAKPPDHVLVVTDQRMPLAGGKKGQELLAELRRRDKTFTTIELTFDEYAQLDALQAIIGDARSGDLEVELPDGSTRPITDQEVIDAYHRHDRYRQHVLLHELLTEDAFVRAPAVEAPVDDEQDLHQFIRSRLALTMGASSIELAAKYIADRNLIDDQLASVKTRLETVATALHQRGAINATPQDDHLYLLYKHGALA